MAKGTSKGSNTISAQAQQYTRQPKQFIPANTQKEAEDFIKQYIDPNASHRYILPTGVSYDGIGLDAANEINKTLSALCDEFDVKLGGISAPKLNTKIGRKIQGAHAAYSSLQGSFLLNRKSFKDLDTINKNMAVEDKTQTDIYKNPQNYNLANARGSFVKLYNDGKTSGRMTVPRSTADIITHEFGHRLERRVKNSDGWDKVEKNMATYAPKISGYACHDKSEYIAESFCSWRKGENKADPELIKIFKKLRK